MALFPLKKINVFSLFFIITEKNNNIFYIYLIIQRQIICEFLVFGDWGLGIGDWGLGGGAHTQNPKTQTPNPKPQ
jgi:hypothetical protein